MNLYISIYLMSPISIYLMSPKFQHRVRASSTGQRVSTKEKLKAKLWGQPGDSTPVPPLTVWHWHSINHSEPISSSPIQSPSHKVFVESNETKALSTMTSTYVIPQGEMLLF